MEAFFLFLLFVFVIVIFIVLLNFKGTVIFNQRAIIQKLDKLSKDFEKLKSTGIVAAEIKPEPIKVVQEKPVEPVKEKIVEKEQIPVVEQLNKNIDELEIKKPVVLQETKIPEYKTVEKENALSIAKKTDFEKFIGENLLNKIGMLVLVIAMIFFGKYAVDKGWLNDTAKVVSIILIGGILIGIAHRLRKDYKAFSSVLAGGGIAALYISIAVGFQLYGLFSQTAAFLILIVITILAVLLSLAYDKQELAVIAIFGGFATPLLVSTGQGNYKILFTYILILDIGMLVLAYFKKWNIVNFVANFATVILFAAWLADVLIDNKILPHQGALFFVTGFYLVFFLMNIVNNIKENSKFTAFEFIMLITNTFLFYWAGMMIINDLNPDYMGLFTIVLAVFNFAFAIPLYRRQQIDKNLVYLLIGLVLTFASIAIPVQFNGNYITMFWAAESVLLLWLSQQSGIRLMKLASYIVSILMIISLAMDWDQIYFYHALNEPALQILVNKGFITGIVSVAAILLNIILLKKDEDFLYFKRLNSRLFSGIYLVAFIITLYLVFLFEIGYQVDVSYENSDLSYVALACYNFAYLAAVLIWASVKKIKFILHGITSIGIIALLIYIFVVAPHYKTMLSSYLIGESRFSFPILHFLTAISVLTICFYMWLNVRTIYNANKIFKNLTTWFAIFIGVVVLSIELDYVVLHLNKPEYSEMNALVNQSHLIGWPILWGVLAFSLMFTGIKKNEKNLRIIGISIFFFALLKFFTVDFMDMPDGGRIIAGASLAVLLLVISFLYQKLKKIILDDESGQIEEKVNNGIE